MQAIAAKIVNIIKDYRNHDGIYIDENHVINWVHQFDEDDREFILAELLHILPSSYLSKDMVIKEFSTMLDELRKAYKYESVEDFLANTKFLSCQKNHKSQTKLLEFLNDSVVTNYGLKLNECGKNGAKYWVYIDDVLASGATFRKEIIAEIDEYSLENFKKDNIQIIPIFFFLHSWGKRTQKFGLYKHFKDFEYFLKLNFPYFFLIENDPLVNVHNLAPRFNNAYISKDQEADEFNDYLKSLKLVDPKQSNFAYRAKGLPVKETFYSSAENRDRYERIILKKGIEILSSAESLGKSTRPLGFTFPNYQTFGTGSHAFTWRNISNTCPIVYWWETNDKWLPLFSVANRGGNADNGDFFNLDL